MKKVLIASLVVVFLVLTTVPASAQMFGKNCHTYNGPSNRAVKVCISVNQHNQTKKLQGLVEFDNVAGKTPVDCLWVSFVQLYKNGSLFTDTNGIAGCSYFPAGSPFDEEQTDWKNCDDSADFFAGTLVKIRWFSGSSSTWNTDSSGIYNPATGDCVF